MGATRVARYVVLGAALCAGPAAAQDSNYWTNQYGTRAELLGGNVVGSIKDLSCVYYNPGAMALVENPELVLTTDAFQIETIEVQGSLVRSGDPVSTDAGGAPSIFAIRIDAIDPLGTRGIALSTLTRHDFRADLQTVRITPAGEPIQDVGYFSGEMTFSQRLHESWYGATLARKYGRFGVGATLFLAYRSQSGRNQTLAASLDGTTGGSTVILAESFSYWHVRFLAKIGVAWDWTDFTFGVSLTTPALGALSSASLLTSASRTNVDGGIGTGDDELVADYQKDLSADFRSPTSIAVGASRSIKERSTIHVTAEYFRRIDEYVVVQGAPFTGQSTGAEIQPEISAASRHVLNYGFGYEYTMSGDVSLYGGAWVDRSTNESSRESGLTVSNWDIYHVTGGANFRVRTIRLTLGIAYARGSAPSTGVIDFENIGGDGQIVRDAEVTYRRLKGVVGLSFEI